jgi:hypothetical protein
MSLNGPSNEKFKAAENKEVHSGNLPKKVKLAFEVKKAHHQLSLGRYSQYFEGRERFKAYQSSY